MSDLSPRPEPEPDPTLLYEDSWLLAVDKAPGLLVHPSWIAPARTPNLLSLLKQRYPGETLHTVHRLDRPTSGVILFARDKAVAQQLQAQFQGHEIEKTYLCVVRGWAPEADVIDYALKPIHDRIADAQANPDKEPKAAVTKYRCLARVELPFPVGRYPAARYSLLEVHPLSGRKHQIRRHMKHILHPMVGDTKYGEGRHNRLFREQFDCQRLMLMATELRLRHPVTGERLCIRAPVTEEVDRLFQNFGWEGLYPAANRAD